MSLRKFLCTLSGDDWWIIQRCDPSLQKRFASVGLFVLIIFALCFASGFFSFVGLFQSYWIGIPAGLFFAFLVTNLYLLLLYTLSRNMLPIPESYTPRGISVVVRFVFIGLIAIFVSKPLEVLFFGYQLDKEVEAFKYTQVSRYEEVTNKFFEAEIQGIQSQAAQELRLHAGLETGISKNARKLIAARENEREQLNARMRNLSMNSNYYIYRIVTVNNKYPLCWLITLCLIAVFIVPAVIKDRIPASGIFYGHKKNVELQLIRQEYSKFKKEYSKLFFNSFGRALDFAEPFEDPPFNTVRKTDKRKFATQGVLLGQIYNG